MAYERVHEPWAKWMRDRNIGDPRNGEPAWSALARKIEELFPDVPAPRGWTLSQIARGKRVDPDTKNLDRMADALGVPRRRVYEAVGFAVNAPGEFEPDADANLLDKREQRAVNEIIRLLAASKKGTDHEAKAEPTRRSELGLAADQRPRAPAPRKTNRRRSP